MQITNLSYPVLFFGLLLFLLSNGFYNKLFPISVFKDFRCKSLSSYAHFVFYPNSNMEDKAVRQCTFARDSLKEIFTLEEACFKSWRIFSAVTNKAATKMTMLIVFARSPQEINQGASKYCPTPKTAPHPIIISIFSSMYL